MVGSLPRMARRSQPSGSAMVQGSVQGNVFPAGWKPLQKRARRDSVLRVDPQRYAFVRGQKDPCILRCTKTGIVLLHVQRPKRIFEQELPRHCEVQAGKRISSNKNLRSEDAILTIQAQASRDLRSGYLRA